jgi:cholesterol oxidase
MRDHCDAIVVGSGFGGSVMAYRLAKEKFSVAVLERGRAYPPNSFPRSPFKMKQNFWDPNKGLFGMFNVWSFRHLAALVSSGLGGGSLIYANVLLRKDEKWFVHEDLHNGGYELWPVTRAALDPHYAAVERMMNAQRYPLDHPPYNATPKTRAMQMVAAKLQHHPKYKGELEWALPPLAVSFRRKPAPLDAPEDPANLPVVGEIIEEPRPNLHGHTRQTCRLCGECDVGCNYGSKNTLDYNYLSEARHAGAEIRTLCEVKAIRPRYGGGYIVDYVAHAPVEAGTSGGAHAESRTVTCNLLILAAGTLGSAYLLLRNREHFPGLSGTLGTRFCGNGDMLSFAVRSCEERDGVKSPRVLDGSYGPVITSYLRHRGAEDGGTGRGFYVEDAGYPDFINWLLQTADAPSAWRLYLKAAKRWVMATLGTNPDTDMGAEISSLFGECALSSSSLPLLGMGRDIPDGRMTLPDGKHLAVDWQIRGSKEFFSRMNGLMRDMAGALQARFVNNPSYYLSRLITVHPLGGCPMGRTAREGVVNERGEVFLGGAGEVYDGLYVADGAVMPGPVGPNPALTIAALANLFADGIIDKRKPVSPQR